MTSAQTTIITRYDGFAFDLDQLETIFVMLASATDEPDYEGVYDLADRAHRQLTEGTHQVSSLLTGFMSKSLTGSYHTGQGLVDTASYAAGTKLYRFECNQPLGRQETVLRGVAINIHKAVDGTFIMSIQDRKWEDSLEVSIAEALGVSRVLTSMTMQLPIELIGNDLCRFDLAEIVRGLKQAGLVRMKYEDVPEITVDSFQRWFNTRLSNSVSFTAAPSCVLECESPDMIVNFGIYGCQLTTYDDWTRERRHHYKLKGTLVTAPRQPHYVTPGEFDEACLSVQVVHERSKTDGLAWPCLHSAVLQEPMRQFADRITNMFD
jgi:hypothetical protein